MIRNERRWDRADAWVGMSGGPTRVVSDQPAPADWRPPRLLGFAPTAVVREPLLWEGDQA